MFTPARPPFTLARTFTAIALALIASGCFTESHCMSSIDCDGDRICKDGECVYECSEGTPCDGDHICKDHHCVTPADCEGCKNRYPNAKGECRGTQCEMAACKDGFYDLNRDDRDGCEYECTASGVETCNQKDDDCNGIVDESFDLQSSAEHCGLCGNKCEFPFATGGCEAKRCRMLSCEDGHYDLDLREENGCEYECTATGVETCNQKDDDCNGKTDEGFNLQSDTANCSECGRKCVDRPNADSLCIAGSCKMVCQSGHYDANNDESDGCESDVCTVTEGGIEICDLVDNDCDGQTDEGIDKTTPESCGPLCTRCPVPANGKAGCKEGECFIEGCNEGFVDLDQIAENGCEYACSVTGDEICDMKDNDCDGQTDEGFEKTTPESCGPLCARCQFNHAEALCVAGGCAMGDCGEGFHDIDGQAANGCEYACRIEGEGIELCDNGKDDDCDGKTDEGCSLDCPEGMVAVGRQFCIDRYEASKPDATATSQGADSSRAVSAKGVLPWRVYANNSLSEALGIARAACVASGKRLCTPSEWTRACRGPDDHEYSYGDEYEAATCNGIDAFCPGTPYPHCRAANSGSTNFHLVPTGTFSGCTNAYGVYDINGNLWEFTDTATPTARGGAFNCSDSEVLHKCGALPEGGSGQHIGNWGPSAIGFRCCSDGL